MDGSALLDPAGGQRWVVYDEAWRLMSHPALLRRMRALASSVLINAERRIVYRQESDQLGATSAALGLTGTEQSLIPTLGTGQACGGSSTRRASRYRRRALHQMHPAELELFDTTGRMTGALQEFAQILTVCGRT